MKNIDKIILNSLKLINYDRSKHITEQIAPNLNYNNKKQKLFTFDELSNRNRPGAEKVNQESVPYLTYKSVVFNQNIYLPIKKVEYVEYSPLKKTLNLPNFDIGSKLGIDIKSLVEPKIKVDQVTKVATIKANIEKTISQSEPYNQEMAEKYFGSQCLKLSGRHPKFDVGYYKKIDYYMDDAGNQCFPEPYEVVSQQVVKKGEKKTTTIETDVWQIDLTKPVTLKNGNTIQKSKFKYPKGCKPINYDFCLRFSWKNLYTFTQNEGVLEFTQNEGSIKNQKSDLKTYRGCISDEWFPWTNRFVGYLNKEDFKIDTDSAGVKQYTKCIAKDYMDTGVNIIENHLKFFNLQSGVKTLNAVSYDKTLKFTLPEAIKESTGRDYNIKANYIDYKIDLKQWFTFGDEDYKEYKTSADVNLTDYLNSVEGGKDFYEDWLKDFYGKEISPFDTRLGGTKIRTDVGIEGLEESFNNEKTLQALTTKWEEISEKYLEAGNEKTAELLFKISEEYVKEKEKSRPNEITLSFLENYWNQTLDISRIDFSRKDNTFKNLNKFTLFYLDDIFGITDKKGSHNPDIIDIMQTLPNKLNRQNTNLKGSGVLKDSKTLAEFNNIPLPIPYDYKNYNTKNINPVTIEDLKSRGIGEGFKNGFLHVEQSVKGIEGENIGINKFLYSTLLSSSTEQKESGTGEMTEEDYENAIKAWETYENTITNIIKSTLVLIGR